MCRDHWTHVDTTDIPLFLTGCETSVVLHMSRIPCYMDLHPGRNVYLTSWFILSVLFLTGGETSTSLKIRVTGDSGHMKGPQTSHHMSKTIRIE